MNIPLAKLPSNGKRFVRTRTFMHIHLNKPHRETSIDDAWNVSLDLDHFLGLLSPRPEDPKRCRHACSRESVPSQPSPQSWPRKLQSNGSQFKYEQHHSRSKLSRLTRITVLVQLLNRPWTKFGEPRLRIHPKRYNPKVLLRHSWIPSTSDSEFFRCGRASIAQHSIQYTLGESYHQTSTLKVFTHSPTLMTLQIVGMYLQRSSCNTFSA